jgi:hypothetical protein
MKRADELRVQLCAQIPPEELIEEQEGNLRFIEGDDPDRMLLVGPFHFKNPKFQGIYEEFGNAMMDLASKLKRYKWTPVVDALLLYEMRLEFRWRERGADDHWENDAVRWLLSTHASARGREHALIQRFRRCGRCDGWFYAATDHQQYCSADCRKRAHADSPEFRAKRREYMRNRYRPGLKEREKLERKRVRQIRRG